MRAVLYPKLWGFLYPPETFPRENKMADFGISLDKEKALREKMACLRIREQDIIESFIRSRGHGGQNVNKSSTCVYLKHIPTGIEVKCQKERSQSLNRYLARRILVSKIEALVLGELSEERQRIEKLRRQKRRRSRKAKLKILEAKRRHSQKKALRSSPREID
jgi:peptide chain release factor